MKFEPLGCICPECKRWIFEDEMPTETCPGCGEPIGHITWKECPRCCLPTDASQPRCQNCSAAFDSLFDDEVIGDAVRLYFDEATGSIDGVVSKDIDLSPWSSQEDVVALMVQASDILQLPVSMATMEMTMSRLIARCHYWRWIYGRGGTAIPTQEDDVMEDVADRIGVLEALAFTVGVRQVGEIRRN